MIRNVYFLRSLILAFVGAVERLGCIWRAAATSSQWTTAVWDRYAVVRHFLASKFYLVQLYLGRVAVTWHASQQRARGVMRC